MTLAEFKKNHLDAYHYLQGAAQCDIEAREVRDGLWDRPKRERYISEWQCGNGKRNIAQSLDERGESYFCKAIAECGLDESVISELFWDLKIEIAAK
jgi:hypothetical protein